MAGDNSFERQMIDFYGEKILDHLNDKYNQEASEIIATACLSIYLDLFSKFNGFSKYEVEKEKNRIQIQLYNQLEIDRQNGK